MAVLAWRAAGRVSGGVGGGGGGPGGLRRRAVPSRRKLGGMGQSGAVLWSASASRDVFLIYAA